MPATPRRNSSAFSLIEVLVAMAVLVLILVLMTQVVDGIMQSIAVQNRQMDSVSAARRALDVMEADIRTAVISEDASILVSGTASPSLAFLTRRRGPQGPGGPGGAGSHRMLAVSYALQENGHLVRAYRSVPFSAPDLLAAAVEPAPANQQSTLSRGILAWQMRILDGEEKHQLGDTPAADANWATSAARPTYNGLTVPVGYRALLAPGPAFASGLNQRAAALEVWIAAIDDNGYRLLEETGQLSTARGALGTEPEAWRKNIDTSNLPPPALSAIRVLNKTIPLP